MNTSVNNVTTIATVTMLPWSRKLPNFPGVPVVTRTRQKRAALRTFPNLFCNFVVSLTLRMVTLEVFVVRYYVKITKRTQFAFRV
jgi:hypothetical protein